MGFELDEIVFKKIANFIKRKRKKKEEDQPHRVLLEEIKPRITLLARALSGAPIDIYPAEREGGYKGRNFFLPDSMALFPTLEDNISYYLFRVLYLSVQRELGLNFTTETDDLNRAREEALNASETVLYRLRELYPAAAKLHEALLRILSDETPEKETPDLTWLYGKFMNPEGEDEGEDLSHVDPSEKGGSGEKDPTVIEAQSVEEIKSLTIDKKQQEDYVLLHNFEKIETAEEFSGSWRDFDGSDQLEEHQGAVEELQMKFTVRVDDPTHSVYQADFVENTSVRESATLDEKGFHIKYHEWDFRKRTYKPDHCKVYPKTLLKTDPDYYRQTIEGDRTTLNGLRKMLSSINNRLKQQRRQMQGEELDIDAVTDLFVDVHSKRSPSEKVYLNKQKKEKDLSILLLLDLSLSSDGYAANSRVIDVEKKVSILFGEILDEFAIDFAIDGFFSKTRNYSTYVTLKEFDEDWRRARNKVGAAEPSGYTRIGAALRHAGARMEKRPTKNQWIIVLSDGKPNDFDRYEGQYGIQDVKQALRELNQKGIHTYALAIEAVARYYLPQMFGHNHYQILTQPNELLKALVVLYERIRHQ